MTADTPRSILEEAVFRITQYKNPDVSDARKLLDPVLKAAGMGSLEYNRIDNISFAEGMIVVDTTYSIRGCTQQAEYVFPEALLSAPDPVEAATRWGIAKQVDDAEERANEVRRELAALERELASREEDILEKKAALDAYDAGFPKSSAPSP